MGSAAASGDMKRREEASELLEAKRLRLLTAIQRFHGFQGGSGMEWEPMDLWFQRHPIVMIKRNMQIDTVDGWVDRNYM